MPENDRLARAVKLMRDQLAPDDMRLPEVEECLDNLPAIADQTASASNHPTTTQRKLSPWFLTVGLATAALLVISLWPSGPPGGMGPSRAYGMSDVVALLRSARILHLEGFLYVPSETNQEPTKLRTGGWVDLVNGRAHVFSVDTTVVNNQTRKIPIERVSDGQCQMVVNHAHKTITFERVTPYERMLDTRENLDKTLRDMFGDMQHLGRFSRIGDETIGQRAYSVWEGNFPQRGQPYILRSKCWVDRNTGDIGRVQVWKHPDQTGPNWRETPVLEYSKIERLDTPPPDAFALTPPDGYQLLNQKATAPIRERLHLGGFTANDLGYRGYYAFVLENGSVILGYTSSDRRPLVPLLLRFRDQHVTWGSEPPKLPIQIYALQEEVDGQKRTYTGRHLTYTRKGNLLVEWALFVPDGPPLPGSLSPARKYHALTRLYAGPAMRPPVLNINVTRAFTVERNEFDTLVRGAMAELSDAGTAPEEVTYSRVMELCRQADESTQK